MRGERTELAEKLVANDGLQTAMLEIVQRDDFGLHQGAVKCNFVLDEPDAPALEELSRNVAIALHHIQSLAAS